MLLHKLGLQDVCISATAWAVTEPMGLGNVSTLQSLRGQQEMNGEKCPG